jgi:S-DNA-T family DNA segregation ATPase FtsK/SpoIIIE
MPPATKSKPRTPARRSTSYRPRKSGARRRGYRRSSHFAQRLRRPQLAYAALGALFFAGVVLVFTAPLIAAAVQALARAFGLGLPLVAAAAAADLQAAARKPEIDHRFLRIWSGLHLLLLFALGVLALWTPGWAFLGADLAEVSAGGGFGRLLVSSPILAIAWAAAPFAAAGLLFPPAARAAWGALCAAAAALAALDIPKRAWDSLRTFAGSLFPRRYDDIEPSAEETYVPQWDEEWAETPAEAADHAEGEPGVTVNALDEEESDMLVTSPPAAEPDSYQRELPMGRPAGRGWELPPYDLLAEAADVELRPVDNEARSKLIVDTLASFGVDARVVAINQGPTVTQFGVEPGWEVKTKQVAVRDESGRPVYDRDGRPVTRAEVVSRTRVRVNKITALANDLALALAAPAIRIEAPVPGKPIIGIEVPNTTTSLVAIRSVIESTAFQKANLRSRLAVALGKGVSGEPVAADLSRMPHLLIAGATGSGKSVCINSIIASLLLHNTPEDLRLVLVDPKRVELATFADIPHLAFSKVIVDTEEIVGTLAAIIHEMDSRYRRFAEIGVRNIEAYNKSPRASHKLPYWVVIIDELADLMMVAPYEVERQLCRLAQLARATGIHLVVATQRPSVDVITGLIKANFPTRIAFAVSSQVDSRTIIDMAGAEKLLGRGDMLFMPTDASKPKRIQGSFVSDHEIEKIVGWWASDRFRHLVPDKLDHLLEEAEGAEAPGPEVDEDPLFPAAKELAVQHSRISTSLLQRRLHIGYPRAARLIDLLEMTGVVAPAAGGGQSREVLISEEDLYGGQLGDKDGRLE